MAKTPKDTWNGKFGYLFTLTFLIFFNKKILKEFSEERHNFKTKRKAVEHKTFFYFNTSFFWWDFVISIHEYRTFFLFFVYIKGTTITEYLQIFSYILNSFLAKIAKTDEYAQKLKEY